MRFVRIEPGSLMMGGDGRSVPAALIEDMAYPTKAKLRELYPKDDPNGFWVNLENLRYGDVDEQPQHEVTIAHPFYIGVWEVTNIEYELFDPGHYELRGKNGLSKADDEAVVNVSWHDANAFCRWLSKKEGVPYRLPTEAEWEYACRAGTTSLFCTGDSLPTVFDKNQQRVENFSRPPAVDLAVGKTPPNAWGLHDMHGNVEEWCWDWYGPYEPGPQTDPIGRVEGDFKVTRGGSHSTELYYLRSANRSGNIPDDRHCLIGFRVVLGAMPQTRPLAGPAPQLFQQNVSQKIPPDLTEGRDPEKPYFNGPRMLVKMPPHDRGPLYPHHNHFMSITDCPNGDLLAIWHTCVNEKGRELAVAGSRLRYGQEQWESASLFWDAPDRNDHGHALWYDGKDTFYHFNGLGITARSVALIMRTSRDNGVTWSKARLLNPEHGNHRMPVESVFETMEGHFVLACDKGGDTVAWVSKDKGLTWDYGSRTDGMHGGIVQLRDGRLMALGRGGAKADRNKMPMSISADMGKTWQHFTAPFPPISGGQRLVLLRLKEGPLFMASFAQDGMNITDASGRTRTIYGLYAAVSEDEGKTWPYRRLISADCTDRGVETIGGGLISLDAQNAEHVGYLSVCQTPNGLIHLISSRQHYTFNLKWLNTPPPAAPRLPIAETLDVRKELQTVYQPFEMPTRLNRWRYVGKGCEPDAVSLPSVGMMKITNGGRWSNHGDWHFANSLDVKRGFTVEIAVQLLQEKDRAGGVELSAVVRTGNLTASSYTISITPSAVYYRAAGKNKRTIAQYLDNTDAMHAYRLAVRNDTSVQIYRDNELLAVERAHLIRGWTKPARGTFIEWGQDNDSPDALIGHVAHDLRGACRPPR
jgi:formylglycine-generating enzyme required for sulfatase activity